MSKPTCLAPWLTGTVCNDRDACATSPSPGRRATRTFAAAIGLLLLASATLGVVPVPGWIPELLSSLLPPMGAIGLVLTIAALLLRARVCLFAATISMLLVLGRLAPGVWTRRVEPAAPGDGRLSLLLVNAYSLNMDPVTLFRFMEQQQADVTIISEPSPAIMRPLRTLQEGPGFSDVLLRCPPTRGEHSWIVVRSHFPAEFGQEPRDGVLGCIVQTPGGPVRLIAAHLLSPRTPARFAQARAQVDRIIEQVEAGAGPIIIAGDLNTSPTSHLSSRLAQRTGTRRAKPLFTGGTYPADLPGPLRVAIDDALVWPACRVVSWETVRLPGSDHVGVRIEIAWSTTP